MTDRLIVETLIGPPPYSSACPLVSVDVPLTHCSFGLTILKLDSF
jgi:hypothetical protein